MFMRGKLLRKPKTAKKKGLFTRKKICRFCVDKNRIIDYKDLRNLESFIKERGKIVSSRFSGNCLRHQRRLAEAIRRARFLALLPATHN